VPNYIVPSNRKVKQTRRMMRMARALVRDKIDLDAMSTAENQLIEALDNAMTRGIETDTFSAEVEEKSVIRYSGHVFDMRTGAFVVGTEQEVTASPVNINHFFDEAGRKVGEGIHRIYWRHRTQGLEAIDEIRLEKIRVAVLLNDTAVISILEEMAAAQVDAWHTSHIDAIENSAEERTNVYDEILGGATTPVEIRLSVGERLLWLRAKTAKQYDKHVFVDSSGQFFEDFKSSWEIDLLAQEIHEDDVVGWYRNRDRQRTSLRVPYEQRGRWLPMYPDFIFVRDVDGQIVLDILDPHDPTRSDAVPKAKGLSRYAEQHRARFGRIQIIAKVGNELSRLELTDGMVRKAIAVAETSEALSHLYETMGQRSRI
jgi:type III restriction enzyme